MKPIVASEAAAAMQSKSLYDACVVGAGYVGLTTALALAHTGRRVLCLESNPVKIGRLSNGEAHFFEPHLDDLLARSLDRIDFAEPGGSLSCDFVILAVGTPQGVDGRADLRQLESACRHLPDILENPNAVVINKCTAPVGTTALIEEWLQGRFAVVSNPEFLRQGAAIRDSLFPERIVVGATSDEARDKVIRLLSGIIDGVFEELPYLPRIGKASPVPVVATDPASAELIKYASNAFLALKISYINEVAAISSAKGADIRHVAMGMGLDSRIGSAFLGAGLGWGGSCFGKDTSALLSMAADIGLNLPTVAAARATNDALREQVVSRLSEALGGLSNRRIAVLGLAFKPNTDDTRDSPGLDIAHRLIREGAEVLAHDPRAQRNGSVPKRVDTAFAAISGAHAVVLATEWAEYLGLDWETVGILMRNPLVFDGRNVLDADALRRKGIEVLSFGK